MGRQRLKTPEYSTWQAMRARCRPGHKQYADYGARGISVCARWSSFEAFLADVGPRPGPEYSIDRINNDGNYEPGNVRWATRTQQNRNRRRPMITAFGETMGAVEWSERTGVDQNVITSRMAKGWTPEAAVSTPVRPARTLTAQGRTLTLPEWSALTGIEQNTLRVRLLRGWDAERVVSTEVS